VTLVVKKGCPFTTRSNPNFQNFIAAINQGGAPLPIAIGTPCLPHALAVKIRFLFIPKSKPIFQNFIDAMKKVGAPRPLCLLSDLSG